MRLGIIALFLIGGLSSCVSSKVYKDLLGKYESLEKESVDLRKNKNQLEQQLESVSKDLADCNEASDQLRTDTARLGREVRKLNRNYADLNRSYEFLLENNNALLTNSARENKKMLERLQDLDMRLQDKQDSLDTEREALIELTERLQKRETRVRELESIIRKQDSTGNYIQGLVTDALQNYDGKGLTVENRNGKVYVSLDNSLLFQSAQWSLNEGAKEALQSLATVLADNPELAITVEGHTDSDEFRGRTAVEDNWDLSVMRATAVVKELTSKEGVDPSRIIASGRGEFYPLVENDSEENKAKNRRTEVIITPDLSALSDLLKEANSSSEEAESTETEE
jgi:chemotaxis protein MotB